ncbi:MAG: tripartite tricarboxylate transporter substrate binding protein [Rhodocyclaceae bacterium]|nr:tripartite tricarboxylate transporter substrate binding protein [Rhodocyclaceae bacterium]MCA3125123.1 tripartite tricarboxylate transporter substrate binding protein [Rhodocyclaceae bacterium]
MQNQDLAAKRRIARPSRPTALAVAISATGAAALLALPSIAAAQAFPAKPIRLVVAQAAGSATDVIARIFTPRWSELLGQPVVVDVRPGAGGSLGAEITAKSPNDGYTLLLANISTHGVNPALYAKLPYDPVKDFSPVSLVSTTANIIVVHPSVPAKTVKELVAIARAKPGMLNYSSAGPGSSQHLAAALLNTLMKIETTHVPYRGSPPALAGVVAGEIAFMIPTLTTALPQIQNGRVRAIAVTGPTREQEVPNIPTVAETIPGYDVVSWWGVVAPANTPRPAVDRLNADLVKTLAAADVKTGLLKVGMNASSTTPEQFAQYIRDEIAKWTKVAKAANIKLE